MQKSGTMPDCVHCRYMLRQQNGEYRCRQHDVTLHSPIRIFCKNIAPPVSDDDDYQQWFQNAVDPDKMETNTLYTWVETTTRDAEGTVETHIDNEVLAPITSYLTWSAGTFWQVLRNVRQSKRDFYEQHGYTIED